MRIRAKTPARLVGLTLVILAGFGGFRADPAEAIEIGQKAPNFTLPDKSGKADVTLSDFRRKKPVVLVFASYT